MKKLFILFFTSLILVGCSNNETEPKANGEVSTESVTLEEQISNVMSENKLSNKEIIDYDIKDSYVYVIFKNSHESGNTHNPDLVILDYNNGKLKWVAGPENRTDSVDSAMIFGREEGSSVTIITPIDYSNIKDIKILGESAKAITYLQNITDDFSREYKYWIAYTNEIPTEQDIEIITE